MKKVIFISTMAALAVLALQCIWIYKVHQSYLSEKLKTIDEVSMSSIGKELDLRSFGFSRTNIQPSGENQEESTTIKQYTLDMNALNDNQRGKNVYEIVQQMEQDALLEQGITINLSRLDSIIDKDLLGHNIQDDYCILLLDEESEIIEYTGALSPKKKYNVTTRLYPIGTQGKQFLQIRADISLSSFIKQMLWILLVSAFMLVIVIGCVTHQMKIIKVKDLLFKQREAGVNGTIHDLKSPLNSIITMLKWLRKKTSDATIGQLIENSLAQTYHLVEDIDSLLITARKDRQRIMLQKENVSLAKLIESARNGISIQYSHKSHVIEDNLPPEEITLFADPMYMTNVFRNLLENALKYSGENVVISISAKKQTRYVEVVVADTGWGIEKKYQKKIFSQFFQIPDSKNRNRQGYGIGLAYVKYIVESHGGYIEIDSNPGEGSVFTIYLPYN